MQPIKVLYEDNHLIAVYKPAGILIQGDKSGDTSLMDEVKSHIKRTYNKPGEVFLGLIHRLDRNVAGVVLFAKTSKGASRLSEQFREHTVKKVYHAWVEGIPVKKQATLKNYLLHHERNNKTEVFDEEVPGSDYAELSYSVVGEKGGGHVGETRNQRALLKIELKTGRQHQIRAQLSHIGHPVLGDVKYASTRAFPDQHIALYATELHFNTATPAQGTEGTGGTSATTRTITREVVSIPVPEEVW